MFFSDLLNFDYFIFDGDGTLFDTNQWKYRNILDATRSIGIDGAAAETFAQRFIHASGIPREDKIYAEYGTAVGGELLSRYNKLNSESLHEVRLVSGVTALLKRLTNEKKKLILYSAGDPAEIREILNHHELQDYFGDLLLGLDKKSVNLAALVRHGKAVYFGDAIRDYLTAKELGYSFVYVDGYIMKAMEFVDSETTLWGRISSYLEIEGV